MKETLEKMKQMKLIGMAKSFQLTMELGKNEKFTPDEMVAYLIECEWDAGKNNLASAIGYQPCSLGYARVKLMWT